MPENWTVRFDEEFFPEFGRFSEQVQDRILAIARNLKLRGPMLGRPHVDTLNGSKHANMKEMRFSADDGAWRVAFAFAFDPTRNAILLVAGDKSDVSEKTFYKRLIDVADRRFDAHLRRSKEANAKR